MEPGVAPPRQGEESAGPLSVGPHGLRIAGVTLERRSVAVPYFGLPVAHWEAALERVASLRCRLVRVDVPWARHETAPGVYEWGAHRPELDLSRFLSRIASAGLLALVRPGPWLETPDVPRHLLSVESVRARGGAPSLISSRLMREADRWLAEVARVVEPCIHPRGPLVGWIASSPRGMPENAGGLLDRSGDALRFHRNLALVLGGSALEPPPPGGPSSPGDLEAALAWVESGESAARSWVTRAAAARPARRWAEPIEPLPAIAAVSDSPTGADARTTADDVDAVSLVLPRGVDRDFAALRRFGLRAADLEPSPGVLGLPAASSPLLPPSALAPATVTAVLAMCGVTAFDLAGLPERRIADAYRRWFRLFDAIELPTMRRRSDLLLLESRETARLREACAPGGTLACDLAGPETLQALRAVPRDLGLRDRPEVDATSSGAWIFDGLRCSGVAFSLADSSASVERLARERTIALVGFERMGRALAQRLVEWTEAGGTLITGPRLPAADWSGAPLGLELPLRVKDELETLRIGDLPLERVSLLAGGEPLIEVRAGVLAAAAPVGRGRLVHFGFGLPWHSFQRDPSVAGDLLRPLCEAADLCPSYAASDPRVETELHEGAVRRFLFAANPTPRDLAVEIALGPREALREVRGSAEHVRAGQSLLAPARAVLLREVVEL